MKVKDIAAAVEEFAPLSVQEEWDNSGLTIGSPEDDIHGVLVGFDCTPALIDEAVRRGADMVVTHHPLIFRGIKKISSDDPVGLAILKAAKAGVAVYAAHTTADKVQGGVSWKMAERLGLSDIQILAPESTSPGFEYGLGAVGNLPEPLSARDAVSYVKKSFSIKNEVKVSRPVAGLVSRVAMCGGSGSSLIDAAMDSGAQLYVSADISYHHFFTQGDFMIMDIGHFESEVAIVDVLFSILKKKFPNFAILVSENIRNSNPVFYY